MPSCCVRGCGARKNVNQPQLTLHKFPRNELLRRKWLDVIGTDKINPRHKDWYVCSLHFDETCFNRTLTVIRLHDGAVPSSSLIPIRHYDQSQHIPQGADDIIKPLQALPIQDYDQLQSCGEDDVNEPLQNALDRARRLIRQQSVKIKKLSDKCKKMQRKNKSLSEKVRRHNKKIALFSQIIKDLQDCNFINSEETVILEECAGAGPEDFLKRQIAKAKGLP